MHLRNIKLRSEKQSNARKKGGTTAQEAANINKQKEMPRRKASRDWTDRPMPSMSLLIVNTYITGGKMQVAFFFSIHGQDLRKSMM